jgi:hypothetical protein
VRACPLSSLGHLTALSLTSPPSHSPYRPLRPLTTVRGGWQRGSRHVELAGLRDPQRLFLLSPSRSAAAQVAYGVPRGWLFRHISCCPHYSAEVLL